jgi:hypothetical protein
VEKTTTYQVFLSLPFSYYFLGWRRGEGGKGGKGEGNICTVLPFSPIIGSNKFLIEQFRGNLFNRYPLVSVLIFIYPWRKPDKYRNGYIFNFLEPFLYVLLKVLRTLKIYP